MTSLLRLWKFSSQIHTEIFLGSRIKAAGNNKEVILDKYKDNLSEIKSSSRFNSLFMAAILLVPAYIALSTIDQSISQFGIDSSSRIFFTNALAVGIYYSFNLIFMMLFGLMTIANLLQGSVFKFLHTLPLSKREIQTLGIMTFIRLLFVQMVIFFGAFPLGILYITRDPVIFGIVFIFNFLYLVITCYILIIIVNKMTGLLFDNQNKFGWKTIFRYLFFVIYIIFGFSIYYFVGSIGQILDVIYTTNIISDTMMVQLNTIISVLGFPFTLGYIISMILFQSVPSGTIILSTAGGIIILLLLVYLIGKKGNQILLNMAFNNPQGGVQQDKDQITVSVKTQPQFRSYLMMNLLLVGRDVGSLISLTMAVLFPLLPVIQNPGQDLFISFIFYSPFIIFFSANSLSTSEGSLGGLISALPISHLTILRGKQVLVGVIYLIAYLLQSIVTGFDYVTLEGLLMIGFLTAILPNIFLIVKSFLFGKINNEYTLFELEDTSNFFKNMGLVIPILIAVGIEFVLFFIIAPLLPMYSYIVIITTNFAFIGILELINRRMFAHDLKT